ncbi:hypothetical protein M0R45_005051 [Rubus argutus]|uniref:Uncharacterized protein n=1 Tax=Rubus argutus TaxID=59490 RepID=A0AAW1YLI3_RUBAR
MDAAAYGQGSTAAATVAMTACGEREIDAGLDGGTRAERWRRRGWWWLLELGDEFEAAMVDWVMGCSWWNLISTGKRREKEGEEMIDGKFADLDVVKLVGKGCGETIPHCPCSHASATSNNPAPPSLEAALGILHCLLSSTPAALSLSDQSPRQAQFTLAITTDAVASNLPRRSRSHLARAHSDAAAVP